MIKPKAIKPGDTVGLICPSSKITAERAKECKAEIENLGYKVKLADNLTDSYHGYMAGDAKTRANWVNKMFADPEVDAIFCIRGGDGSARIMKYLDYDVIKANPKIFVGYSDVTNLLTAFVQNCEMVTYHGPMVSSNMVGGFDEENKTSLFEAINGSNKLVFKNPIGYELETLKGGVGTGKLIGGNLSLLSASIGTDYEFESDGCIVFIEEISEPMSKIDKWLFHLRNSGKFDNCKGVILGQFKNCPNEDDMTFDYVACAKDALEGLDIPVMYNIQAGHDSKNMTLPIGATCTMDADNKVISFEF